MKTTMVMLGLASVSGVIAQVAPVEAGVTEPMDFATDINNLVTLDGNVAGRDLLSATQDYVTGSWQDELIDNARNLFRVYSDEQFQEDVERDLSQAREVEQVVSPPAAADDAQQALAEAPIQQLVKDLQEGRRTVEDLTEQETVQICRYYKSSLNNVTCGVALQILEWLDLSEASGDADFVDRWFRSQQPNVNAVEGNETPVGEHGMTFEDFYNTNWNQEWNAASSEPDADSTASTAATTNDMDTD